MRKLILITLAAVLLNPLAALAAKKVVCWNDDQGHRMCGDTVPPQYAKKEQRTMNKQGIVVETKAREKTAEEVAADAVKAEEAKRAQEQAKYDSYLVQTYQKVADLEAVRKERVATLEGRLTLAEKSVVDMQGSVKGLHDRVEALKKANKEPDKKLAAQIREYDKALLDNMQSVVAIKQEREKTIVKFDKDIARFKELKPPAATPAAPSKSP